jgi:altronate dehydratase/mannitol-1-phosphate/altronate dehydrogenase
MALPRLTREWLRGRPPLPAGLEVGPIEPLPERILQYGEGSFLRGFVDWMVDGANAAGPSRNGVVVVQPRPGGRAAELEAQGGCYTVLTRGLSSGRLVTERRLATSVQRAIDPYRDFAAYQACATSPELRVVVSNTTEAGIVHVPQAYTPDAAQPTFPGKVCAMLHERFQRLGPEGGLTFLPCELIERNGATLRDCVLRHAADWRLGTPFAHWVERANVFCDTLVDRIVPGYPAAEAAALWAELGYEDRQLIVAEPFHLWVIEGPATVADLLPLARASYQVIHTDDLQPYRSRKVLVLNGAHTAGSLAAFHAGLDTVEQMMADPITGAFVRRAVREEILPGVPMDDAGKAAFADTVLERLRNPFIRHELLGIALNSVSKWKVRVLPSLEAALARTGALPPALTFSLAALLHFYRGEAGPDGARTGRRGEARYPIRDEPTVLEAFTEAQGLGAAAYARRILSNAALWGRDLSTLPGLVTHVVQALETIDARGMRPALETVSGGTAPRVLVLRSVDDVAVALTPVPAGTVVSVVGHEVAARVDIPAGHKIALVDVPAGGPVFKYGAAIGKASVPIRAGDWVHEHNLATRLAGDERFEYQPTPPTSLRKPPAELGFEGYARADGQVGIRNELWIVPTVGCVNGIADRLTSRFRPPPPGVDAVVVLAHPYGCSQLGEDHERTRDLLAAMCSHPNAAGILVLGLGCESNTMSSFRTRLGPVDAGRVRFLLAQEVEDELAAGTALLHELAANARQARRVRTPLSMLRVGLKCGGSDGFSGITANPLVGALSDLVNAAGGATALTEIPEMFGAEGPLLDRCTSRAVFDGAVGLVDGFKRHYLAAGHPVSENPSPGNRQGGITTLEEKSLGCTQKGGMAPVSAVLRYGERIRSPGLNLVEGPGNDMVAVTALAAAGCQLVLFTTGRGTPLGGPVPVLKIATNSAMARKKSEWIDLDAGRLLSGDQLPVLADELLRLCVEVASGRRTASESMGARDFAIWRGGVTL